MQYMFYTLLITNTFDSIIIEYSLGNIVIAVHWEKLAKLCWKEEEIDLVGLEILVILEQEG